MTGSAKFCANGFRYERVDGAGHWMQIEAAEKVNALLRDFLPLSPFPWSDPHPEQESCLVARMASEYQ